jgi:hypothetical protein
MLIRTIAPFVATALLAACSTVDDTAYGRASSTPMEHGAVATPPPAGSAGGTERGRGSAPLPATPASTPYTPG